MKYLRRNLSLMLAVRYLNPLRTLFSVITLICLAGVALGVMVLIVVLSVMEGLQTQMEARTLAFTPQYTINADDGQSLHSLEEEAVDWPSICRAIEKMPGVTCAYPHLAADAFTRSEAGRLMTRFEAIEPHNESQVASLRPMLRAGTFDFGDGLDQECVVSLRTAESLALALGDKIHITPVGSLDQVADIYSIVELPLQTHENKQFMADLADVFDGARSTPQGDIAVTEKLENILDTCFALLEKNKLRLSEKEALQGFCEDALNHRDGAPFSAAEKQTWLKRVQELAELDRDREDGKAWRQINEMVLPMDLTVVGIYQPPENMPGPNLYIPLPIAQDLLGYNKNGENAVMGICVRTATSRANPALERAMLRTLPDLRSVTGDPDTALRWQLLPWSKQFEQWYKLIANERIMMSFVLSFISLIASFCIMAVMFTMSMQRRREIAVLQAIGATPGKIMAIFTWQGLIIGFAGAVSGVLLALLVLHYRLEIQTFLAGLGLDPFPMEAHGISLPAAYNPSTFAFQAIFAFITVTCASVIPALFISRQDPAKALRSN